MNKLLDDFANQIASGLKRSGITNVSTWSERYRVMGQPFPGKWNFDHHPWLREICDAKGEMVVGQKAAQMGYTEAALNRCLKAIDIDAYSVLYVLPASNPDASDFSTSRFDPALELSPHLQNIFSDVKNIQHKRAGNANLFIRGSRSRSQLKSLPVGIMIFDEVDEMVQEHIELALERMSGQLKREAFMLSTPTIERYGINEYFHHSTQDHFMFKCPCCSRITELQFPDCLVIPTEDVSDPKILDSYLICKECKGVLPHEAKPDWLHQNNTHWNATYPGRNVRGFYVNQMYSFVLPPSKIAESVLKARYSPSAEQELYNSKLGLPHAVDGARVTEAQIVESFGSYKKGTQGLKRNLPVTMGIDVGATWLHVTIDQWHIPSGRVGYDINEICECKTLFEAAVHDFADLDGLMTEYNVAYALVDAQPERRSASKWAMKWHGRASMVFYASQGLVGKQFRVAAEDEYLVLLDRTTWMDIALGRFKAGTITLPADTSYEYKMHIKAPVRVYKTNKQTGADYGVYVTGNQDDHFAHARTYSEAALKMVMSNGSSKSMGEIW